MAPGERERGLERLNEIKEAGDELARNKKLTDSKKVAPQIETIARTRWFISPSTAISRSRSAHINEPPSHCFKLGITMVHGLGADAACNLHPCIMSVSLLC